MYNSYVVNILYAPVIHKANVCYALSGKDGCELCLRMQV
ncbi:hypothetical protein SLEP1_g28916 [Rubroshorea leprosula]|uniref:Uncharacterized protein n=1 Tax=Rubroshorea leprosula TaxID=152421 RepID=A0AAV5JXS6_9ROSI|nr:hypothetical protein SLEP1_g28916 [Rubroshorea leprosula]